MTKDYYEIMGLTPEATGEEIKKTYRKLAMQYHPDRNLGDPECEERLKKMNEAYQVLGDEQKRRHYDLFFRNHLKESRIDQQEMDGDGLRNLWAIFHQVSASQRMGGCRRRGFAKKGCRRWMWDL
jgi:DnaJ-class molecular chaperone